ncbi:MAG: DUF4846 domain-containing protein [Chloroflexia bacterium]|nr:DUF4846 domain-containing protein [Chloroflexia bacterium]
MTFIRVIFISILILTGNFIEVKINKNCPTENKRNYLIKNNPSKVSEIELPDGFIRDPLDTSSFAFYLRNLPLDTTDNTIYSYDGSVISNGGYHHSIIDMDIGNRDLQQCADAIMRLRAEYLFHTKQFQKIHFNFLSDGKPRYYNDYCTGDKSYKKFRKYLDYIFSYANSSSLRDEMEPVSNIENLQIGDCFVQKGTPIGHAVIIVDIANHKQTNEKIFLVAQSYMPAQSIHILYNLNNSKLTPWYSSNFEVLKLPGWTFYKKDLRHFK